jgi:nickel superoxide dismutase
MRIIVILGCMLSVALLGMSTASAHCQVPCGIYDDHARIHAMTEDATTIAKATDQIAELSGKKDAQSANQIVRWIQTKEDHASHIIEVVSTYFLTQKIKPADPGNAAAWKTYISKLTACHQVMRAAMATKQRVNPDAAAKLQTAIDQLKSLYPHP